MPRTYAESKEATPSKADKAAMTPDIDIPRPPSPPSPTVISDDEDDEVTEVVDRNEDDGDQADASSGQL